MVRHNGNIALLINGAQEGNIVESGTNFTTPDGIGIGGSITGTPGSFQHSGYIDEFRVSVGHDRNWIGGIVDLPSAAYDTTPQATSVLLNCHLNGASNDTTITDSSPTPKTCAAINDAELSSAQAKFGSTSAIYDGTDGIEVSAHADFNLQNRDHVVHFWIYVTARQVGANSVSELIEWHSDQWVIEIPDETLSYPIIVFNRHSGTAVIAGADETELDTWHHVAWIVRSDYLRIYLDGVQQGITYDIGAYRGDMDGARMVFGCNASLHLHGLIGHQDELIVLGDTTEIMPGVDGWGGFTPPASAYSSGALAGVQAAIMG